VFLRERYTILPNDVWRVAVDLVISYYELLLPNIRDHMLVNRKEFTSIYELKQSENLLNNLQSKLLNFQQLLPMLDSRRGILNLGGIIKNTLLGNAISHVHPLQETDLRILILYIHYLIK